MSTCSLTMVPRPDRLKARAEELGLKNILALLETAREAGADVDILERLAMEKLLTPPPRREYILIALSV